MPAYKDTERNTWYTIFRYTDWSGTRKQAKKRGFNKKSDAIAYEREFIKRLHGSTDMTFQSLYDIYIKDCESHIRFSTLDKKKQLFLSKILPYFKDMKLTEITPNVIRNWQNDIITNNTSPTYIKKINDQLRIIFNFAIKYYNLQKNPVKICGNIGKLKTDKPMLFWTKDEFNKFIDIFKDDITIKAAFEILFYTGIRIGEFLALTLNDIDFNNKRIRITKTYIRLHQKTIISDPKTPKSKREIDIPDFLLNDINSYVSCLYDYDPKDRLFQFTERVIRNRIEIGSKKANIKRIRIHDLRHSHASLLIEMGFPPLLIAERLGHEKVETTLNTYSHLYPNKQSDISLALEKLYGNSTNVTKTLP